MSTAKQTPDRNGRVIDYDYDRLDQLTTEKWFIDAQAPSPNRVLSFSYDLAGRLLTSSDPDHNYTYQYDALDRTITDTQVITGLTPSVFLLNLYDAAGNRRLNLSMIGSTADFKNNYAVDGLNRLTEVSFWFQVIISLQCGDPPPGPWMTYLLEVH